MKLEKFGICRPNGLRLLVEGEGLGIGVVGYGRGEGYLNRFVELE